MTVRLYRLLPFVARNASKGQVSSIVGFRVEEQSSEKRSSSGAVPSMGAVLLSPGMVSDSKLGNVRRARGKGARVYVGRMIANGSI